jgi:hypothetical protein
LLLSVVANTGLAKDIDEARKAAAITIATANDIFELFIIFWYGFIYFKVVSQQHSTHYSKLLNKRYITLIGDRQFQFRFPASRLF